MLRKLTLIFTLLFLSICFLNAQNCSQPLGLVSSTIKANSAGVFWQEIPDAQTYKVEWRPAGAMFWTSATTLLNSYRILNLDICSDYEVRVRANCAMGQFSTFSDVISFKTNCIPDCDAPIGNYTTNITDSTALLNWTMADSTAFVLRFRAVGDTAWQLYNVNAQQLFISDLAYCTSYEWQISTLCPWATGDFGILRTFTTYCGQCEAPEGLTVYDESQTGAIFAWRGSAGAVGYEIQWREQGQTGWQAPQYTPLNGFTLNDLEPCKMYEYRCRSLCVGDTSAWSQFPVGFSTLCSSAPCDPVTMLQVDNIDTSFINISWPGDPTVVGYTVQFRAAAASGWTSLDVLTDGFVTVPNLLSCTDYQIRIRTNCTGGVSTYADTTLVTTACVLCDSVTGLIASGVGYSEASFVWSSIPSALSYELQYRNQNGAWISDTLSSNALTLTDLTNCTNYEVRVRSLCQNLNSTWSDIVAFQTQCCTVPTNLNSMAIRQDSAQITWDNAANGLWLVRYKAVSDTAYLTFFSNTNTAQLSGLTDCAQYEVEVAALCGNDTTAWASTFTFDSYCCPMVTDLMVDGAPSLSQTLTWTTNVPDTWIIDVLNINSGQNTTILSDTNVVELTNLTDCTDYHVRLSTTCGLLDSFTFSTICCPAVTNPSVSIQNGIVSLIWQSDSTNTSWLVSGLNTSTGAIFDPILRAEPFIAIPNLDACSDYIFEIQALCSGVPSPSTSLSFATPCCPQPVLSADTVGINFAEFSWTGDPLSTYVFNLISAADSVQINLGQGLSSGLLLLDSCTMYTASVAAVCNGFPSDFSVPLEFMSLCTSSSADVLKDASIRIFPNPAHHLVWIKSSADIESIQIYNASGRAVLSEFFSGKNEISVSVEHLPKGVYIMRVGNKTQVQSHKLFVD